MGHPRIGVDHRHKFGDLALRHFCRAEGGSEPHSPGAEAGPDAADDPSIFQPPHALHDLPFSEFQFPSQGQEGTMGKGEIFLDLVKNQTVHAVQREVFFPPGSRFFIFTWPFPFRSGTQCFPEPSFV